MYRISAVIAIAGTGSALFGILMSMGWMILAGMLILVISVVMGALYQSSGVTTTRTHRGRRGS